MLEYNKSLGFSENSKNRNLKATFYCFDFILLNFLVEFFFWYPCLTVVLRCPTFVKVSLDGSSAAGSLHHNERTCRVGDTEDSDCDEPSSDSR